MKEPQGAIAPACLRLPEDRSLPTRFRELSTPVSIWADDITYKHTVIMIGEGPSRQFVKFIRDEHGLYGLEFVKEDGEKIDTPKELSGKFTNLGRINIAVSEYCIGNDFPAIMYHVSEDGNSIIHV